MKLDSVLHIPMSEYCHGLDEKRIVYRLRCARDDLKKVTLAYGDTACRMTPIIFTPVPMEKVASDALYDYWQVIVESLYNRVYYYFLLDDAEQDVNSVLLDWHTFTDPATLRRELYDYGFLDRSRDGKVYHLAQKQPTPEKLGI